MHDHELTALRPGRPVRRRGPTGALRVDDPVKAAGLAASDYAGPMEVAGTGRRQRSPARAGARGGDAVAARRALVRDAGPSRAEEPCSRAHAIPARPRPPRPLEAVPPPEGEDAGVHRPRGRPLPDAHDAHARDDRDLPRRRAGPAAQRGPRRGDRARARHGPHAVRACRRAGARRGASRALRPALPAQRAVVPHRASSSISPTRSCDGILTHTGAQEPATHEGKIVRIVDRIAYVNHDIDDALRYGLLAEARPSARRDRASRADGRRADRHARPRPRRDVRSGRRHLQGEEVGEAMLSLRAFMFERVYLGPQVRPEHRRARAASCGDLRRDSSHEPELLPPGRASSADADHRLPRGHDRPFRARVRRAAR